MPDWNYGGAIERYPVEVGRPIEYSDGSTLMCYDIFNFKLPDFMRRVDVLFVDGPWNLGNLRSFYTKAERECPADRFETFYWTLFGHDETIKPEMFFLEIGKDYLGEYMVAMKSHYKHVTVYNSTYYHKRENRCYIVQGSGKRLNLRLDDMDEEDIIDRLGDVTDGNMGDLCMGRGLVALSAAKRGRKFFGTELNPKRLAVCVERLAKMGVTPVEGIHHAA